MSTSLSTDTTNPHIAVLETIFDRAAQPIEWLVIAIKDPRMIRSLSFSLGDESAAVLEVAADEWDPEGDMLSEAVEWALQHGEPKKIVIAGNAEIAELEASLPEACDESGYGRQLAAVKRRDARRREAQKRLGASVQQVSQIPVVHDRWANGELAVSGLFYRSETGFFVSYDAETDVYSPARW